MRKQVFRAARVVIVAAEAQVALLVNVDTKWVPAWDDYPHADIKFAIHDQHWVLNVLLDYPCLLGVALGVIERHLSLNFIHVVLRIDHVLIGTRSCSLCICSLYLLGWVHFCILQNLLKVFEKAYLTTTRKTSRFDDPQIVSPIEVSLRINSSQLRD